MAYCFQEFFGALYEVRLFRRMLVHVVCEFRQLLRGDSQGFGGVRADGRHNLVVEVLDEFRNFFLQALGRVVDRLADTGRRVFDLAVEVGHGTPRDVTA